MVAGPRILRLSVKGYRSVDGWVHLDFPDRSPLVLIGENNSGKSNLFRALTLICGDFWPGNHSPEDHEFFGRSPEGSEIRIGVATRDLACGSCGGVLNGLHWRCDPDEQPPTKFWQSGGCGHSFVSGQTRSNLTCMPVGVNRDLSYQLSYSTKWTTLSKLMRRFHERLVAEPDRVDRLRMIYGDLVNTFNEVEEFQAFSDGLKRSFADFGGNLRYGLGVDFSAYDASNYFRSLRIFPHMDGSARTYEELGTGQEQVLAMSFAHAYATAFGGDGLVLAIEEPESHLHPLAQQWLAGKLRGLAASGVQVLMTTHSPYFVDLAVPEATVLVRKDESTGATVTTQFNAESLAQAVIELGAPPEKVTAATVGAFYESASTYDTLGGMFSRGCILVEGATEAFALPELLRRVGYDVMREGVAVVPVDGITNMPKWVRLFRSYGLPVFAILDTDTNGSEDKRRIAQRAADETLAALGHGDSPQLLSGGVFASGPYACFDPNLEGCMRTLFGSSYLDLETRAAETVGASKQLKARYCARHLPAGEAGWDSIRRLADAIRGTMPAPASTAGDRDPVPPPITRAVSRPAAPR